MYYVQNPNALDSKVLLDFDHVKNSLKVDDEGMLAHSFLTAINFVLVVNLDVAAFVVALNISYDTFRFFSLQNYRK